MDSHAKAQKRTISRGHFARKIFIFLAAILASGGMFFVLRPVPASAATFSLVPSSGTITIGQQTDITLTLGSPGQAINAAEAVITFPSTYLAVDSVTKGALFNHWPVGPVFSNAPGTVTFAGGLPSPGFSGDSGTVFAVAFRGVSPGAGVQVCITAARILANDGNGTDVLQPPDCAVYDVVAGKVPPAPQVTSSTHPDQNAWYPLSSPAISWTIGEGVLDFSYVLDRTSGTQPDEQGEGIGTAKTYTGLDDGIWYFHVRAKNIFGWGATGHFTLRIDTVAPLPFAINLLDGQNTESHTPRISFETTDATSGVQYYEIMLNGGPAVTLPVGSTLPYTFSQLQNGEYTVIATAVDYSGNRTTASTLFTVVSPTLLNRIDQIINITKEQIAKILPAPVISTITNVTKDIAKTIETLRSNTEVTNVFKDIVQPTTSTAAIIATVGVATSTATVELTNIFYLLFRFGYFWLLPISFGKKRKPWGVVFDSSTGRPIKGVMVRIFAKEFNKLKETQITDDQGRFGFLVDIGEYYVTVSRPGYFFPSRLILTPVISRFENIYRGEVFSIKERIESAISINVPIDPDDQHVSRLRLNWLRVINLLGVILDKMNAPLLIGGTLLSWATLIMQPRLGNYLVLALYGFLILVKFYLAKRVQRSWGIVRDAVTDKPVELAVVRIHNIASGAVAATKITNGEGKFSALVMPGQYYLMVIKAGYQAYQSKTVNIVKQRGLITTEVRLRPIEKKQPQISSMPHLGEPPAVQPRTTDEQEAIAEHGPGFTDASSGEKQLPHSMPPKSDDLLSGEEGDSTPGNPQKKL